ncbi:alpha/beta fold hydrolase [Anianabacter salinae]|uniref:alpha/beta fold hydrolase n=1 Tax=Anianabacter salinae TaxID=2851023 RepID=UPI00225DF344|nr:alpha/beta hydrolase [Anianabacter salinae]
MAASLVIAALGLAGCGVLVDARADRREAEAARAYPPQGQLLDVGGRTVHAVVTGSGPDLVLIHGASGNTRDFTFQFVDRVKDRYRVIVFDRPGLGYTDRVSPAYEGAARRDAESPAEQAILLQAAAAQLGADTPLVLGHSYGGAVALAWALERPDDLSGLVIVSGASNPWDGGLGFTYNLTATRAGGVLAVPLITAFASESVIKGAVASIFEPQSPPEGYLEYVGAPLTLRRDSVRANGRQVNTLKPHVTEMATRYDQITVPTEIVHGTADEVVPLAVHSEPLSRQIPGAYLVALDGIGHMPHHVAPDEVVAAIDRAATRAGLR